MLAAEEEDSPKTGLWEYWQGSDGQLIESCSILTTGANNLMAPIHEKI